MEGQAFVSCLAPLSSNLMQACISQTYVSLGPAVDQPWECVFLLPSYSCFLVQHIGCGKAFLGTWLEDRNWFGGCYTVPDVHEA